MESKVMEKLVWCSKPAFDRSGPLVVPDRDRERRGTAEAES